MSFIYLYHGDLCSDLWKSDLYFRPALHSVEIAFSFQTFVARTRANQANITGLGTIDL